MASDNDCDCKTGSLQGDKEEGNSSVDEAQELSSVSTETLRAAQGDGVAGLLPCPFCGVVPTQQTGDESRVWCTTVINEKPCALAWAVFRVEAWNTRTPSQVESAKDDQEDSGKAETAPSHSPVVDQSHLQLDANLARADSILNRLVGTYNVADDPERGFLEHQKRNLIYQQLRPLAHEAYEYLEAKDARANPITQDSASASELATGGYGQPTAGADGRYCVHHDDDPAHTKECYEAPTVPESLRPETKSKFAISLPGQVGVTILKIVRYALTAEHDKVRHYTNFLADQLQTGSPELAEGLRLYAAQDFGKEVRLAVATPVVEENQNEESESV